MPPSPSSASASGHAAPRRIVVLTGAGISAESGLPTFRGANGLWEGHRFEEVATPEAYARDPALVQGFYNARRRQLLEADIAPNAAHVALARLEAEHPGEVLLVTQNVDDLHERAGSRGLLHMHGELLKARHRETGEVRECVGDLDSDGPDRPHIVWFGEMPLHMEAIHDAVAECDLFVAVGTSGTVYPAAALVDWTGPACRRVLLNLEASDNAGAFGELRPGPASETVPPFVDELLSAAGVQPA